MKVKALLYVGLLIALPACTGMPVNNEPLLSKEQAHKHLTKKYSLIKDQRANNTKRMMAWIDISKD